MNEQSTPVLLGADIPTEPALDLGATNELEQ